MRETTKPWKVFLWTWSGLFFSQFLIELLGAALMTTIGGSDAFTAAYNARGVGGLTDQVFEGYGTGVRNFGKFIQAILSFSVVAVVITYVYSLGLNVQIISDYLMKVPRLIWSLIGGAAFLVRSVCSILPFARTTRTAFLQLYSRVLTPLLHNRSPQLQDATTFNKSWKTS
jgi:purine-cytosine permease-like protein